MHVTFFLTEKWELLKDPEKVYSANHWCTEHYDTPKCSDLAALQKETKIAQMYKGFDNKNTEKCAAMSEHPTIKQNMPYIPTSSVACTGSLFLVCLQVSLRGTRAF